MKYKLFLRLLSPLLRTSVTVNAEKCSKRRGGQNQIHM